MLDNSGWVRGPEYQAYAVLTMCRALYALEFGEIISKPAAARWAQAALDPRWQGLIARALADGQLDDLAETLNLIRLSLRRGNLQ
jgi:hypothetical protein